MDLSSARLRTLARRLGVVVHGQASTALAAEILAALPQARSR